MNQLLRFVRDVRAEANRITWPSAEETRRLTLMVFILVVLVSVYLVGVDLAVGGLMSFIFNLKF